MRRQIMRHYVIALTAILQLPFVALADFPQQINHQGVIRVGGLPFSGTGLFKFAIVDPEPVETVLWSNDGTLGEPLASVSIQVAGGIYSVILGDIDIPNMTAIPSNVFDDNDVTLRIWFDDSIHGEQQLTPDQPLTSSPYSHRAATADFAVSAAPGAGAIPGEIRMWAGSRTTIPPGWVECDGTALDKNLYPQLFEAIQTIYGGDGNPMFNLPNFENRSPMGSDADLSGGPGTSVSGSAQRTGGAATHTLTVSEMPSHNHSYVDVVVQQVNGNVTACFGCGYLAYLSIGKTTGSAGSNSAHNNLHPYFAITFIIFTGE